MVTKIGNNRVPQEKEGGKWEIVCFVGKSWLLLKLEFFVFNQFKFSV